MGKVCFDHGNYEESHGGDSVKRSSPFLRGMWPAQGTCQVRNSGLVPCRAPSSAGPEAKEPTEKTISGQSVRQSRDKEGTFAFICAFKCHMLQQYVLQSQLFHVVLFSIIRCYDLK